MTSTQPVCIKCLSQIGWGIKRICRQTTLAKSSVRRFMIAHGLTDEFLAASKKEVENARRKRAAELGGGNKHVRRKRAIAQRAAERAATQGTKPKLTQMEKYYANHDESKARSRLNARNAYYRRERGGQAHIRHALRCRIKGAIKRNSISSRRARYGNIHWSELLGCTIAELRAHLELLFQPGMSWDNYGAWEIDHLKPCASFDLSDPAQQRTCFHHSNLQPLWRTDNRRKWAN